MPDFFTRPIWPTIDAQQPFDATVAFPNLPEQGPQVEITSEDRDYDQPAPGPEDGGAPSIWTQDQQGAYWYNRYEICVRTQERTGLAGAPLATPKGQGEAVVWRVHGGFAKLTVCWVVERVGQMPVMPHWSIPSDPNYVLEFKEIVPDSPPPGPDGASLVWRACGMYIYLLKFPPGEHYYYPVGALVVTTIPAVDLRIGPSQFSYAPLSFMAQTGAVAVDY